MNAFHLYNVTVFKWAFSSLLCLTLIGCQKQQPSEAVQQDSELNSYVDEQD